MTTIIKDYKKLDELITTIGTNGKVMDENIHTAACSCLDHFANHGNTSLASRLVGAMPKSGRRKALVYWFTQFGPLSFDEKAGTFSKAKGKKGNDPVRVDDAVKTPFWEYTVEKNPAPFDIMKELARFKAKYNKAKDSGEAKNVDLNLFIAGLQAMVEPEVTEVKVAA